MIFVLVALNSDEFEVDLQCRQDGCGFDVADAKPKSGDATFKLTETQAHQWWLDGSTDNEINLNLEYGSWMTYELDGGFVKTVKFNPYTAEFKETDYPYQIF